MKHIITLIMAAVLICGCSSTGRVQNADEEQPAKGLDMTGYTDIISYIEGRYPGVYVEDGELRIRGAEQPPLYVVDGSTVFDISDINPIDVKSIEIIKGPDASIYGMQGENGVIAITLKKGPEMEK